MSIRFDSKASHQEPASKIGWFSGKEKARIHLGSKDDKTLSIALVKDQVFSKADLLSGKWEWLLGLLGLRNWVALKIKNTQKPEEELYVKVHKNSLITRTGITGAELKAITQDNILNLNLNESSKLDKILAKREALDSVSENGNCLKDMSEDLKNDYDIIFAAIQKNPEAIQYITDSTYTKMNGRQQQKITDTIKTQLKNASHEIQKQICGANRPWTPFLVQYLSPQPLNDITNANPTLYQTALSTLMRTLMDQVKEIENLNNPVKAIETSSDLEITNDYQARSDTSIASKFDRPLFTKRLTSLMGQVNKTPEVYASCSTACFLLRRCYAFGIGGERNDEEAFLWYKLAANRGYVAAQGSLGWCYSTGTGIQKDEQEAFKWYKLAAEQGFATVQYNLAICCQSGVGTEKSDEEAFKWYKLAAEQGNARAQNDLGIYYKYGVGIEKDEKEAFKWFTYSAEQGNPRAQYNLGTCYQRGTGVEKDEKEAFKWYKSAAEQGLADAQHNLGACYQRGAGTEKSDREAFKWYKLAAEQGNARGQTNLGICYEKGLGTDKDDNEAFKWYSEAAKQGLPSAQYNLGLCYEYGKGVEKNEKAAFKWCELAADQGLANAQAHLR